MSNSEVNNAFSRAFHEALELQGKVDGVSAKLLVAMYEAEVTFDLIWIKRYFSHEKGSERVEQLHKTLIECIPTFKDLLDTARMTVSKVDPNKTVLEQERKMEAQRKIKTAENTLRNVIIALSYFRLSAVDSVKLINQKKLSFTINQQQVFTRPVSVADLISFGNEALTKAAFKKDGKKSVKTSAGTTASVAATAENARRTTEYYQGALSDLSKAVMMILKTHKLDNLSDSEVDAVRQLEHTIVSAFYGDESGKIDVQTLSDYYKGEDSSVKEAA